MHFEKYYVHWNTLLQKTSFLVFWIDKQNFQWIKPSFAYIFFYGQKQQNITNKNDKIKTIESCIQSTQYTILLLYTYIENKIFWIDSQRKASYHYIALLYVRIFVENCGSILWCISQFQNQYYAFLLSTFQNNSKLNRSHCKQYVHCKCRWSKKKNWMEQVSMELLRIITKSFQAYVSIDVRMGKIKNAISVQVSDNDYCKFYIHLN